MDKNRLALHLAALLLIAFFVFLAIGSGAYSTPMVFDESVPPEESAIFFFVGGLEITSYNGIPVPTKKDPLAVLGMKSEWRNITLPAGEIEFGFDAVYVSGTTMGGGTRTDYIFKDRTFTYTFEPGIHYMLWFRPLGEGRWGINISRVLPKNKSEHIDNVIIASSEGAGVVLQ